MTTYLPKEVQEGLEAAHRLALRKKDRLRVESDGCSYPILRFWDGGFSLTADNAPYLRGVVDIFDGARRVMQCLVIASSGEHGEVHYEFKRATTVLDRMPLDFVRDEGAPVALIARGSF